jgi:ABC-type uncharacterized transport system ATPase subunit
MNTVIKINQLTLCFKETMAVNQLSLEVHAGEIFGFLGHNGAGKTTTVHLLNGVIEPTSGLDPIAAHHVNDLIERMVRRENSTVFLTTHNLVDAQKLCDRMAVLEHGQLMALGTPSELTRQYVCRLDVEIEVHEEQVESTLQTLRNLQRLVGGEPVRTNGALTATLAWHETIPDLLEALIHQSGVPHRCPGSQPGTGVLCYTRRKGECTMNARAIGAIIRKDLKVVSQNKRVMLTTIIPILLLFIILRWVVILLPILEMLLDFTSNDVNEFQ